MTTLDELVEHWVNLPDISENSGLGISQVRRLVEDRALVGLKCGQPKVFRVPAEFLLDWRPVKHLKGTISTLTDAGFSDAEIIGWLLTPDESLPGRPIDMLRAGQKTEVRRRAQALAF